MNGGDDNMRADVRVNLRNVIKDKGYKQSVIAKKANLSPVKFSQILNLERKLEANELYDVCFALDMTPMELKEYTSVEKDEKDMVEV